jgi:hypothetical protein
MGGEEHEISPILELLLRSKELRKEAEILLEESEEIEAEAMKRLSELRKSVDGEAGSKIVWLDQRHDPPPAP